MCVCMCVQGLISGISGFNLLFVSSTQMNERGEGGMKEGRMRMKENVIKKTLMVTTTQQIASAN